METVEVDIPGSSYPILIRHGALEDSDWLRSCLSPCLESNQVALISNEVVAPLYGDKIINALAGYDLDMLILPDGEKHKNMASYEKIMNFLIEKRKNRTCSLIALGGGVVGDLVGFAAATYQRGVPFVQVPTTLLAQVDSSVGGKTGINHSDGKNMVGSFYQPKLVIADSHVFSSLPDREFAAGLAEVVKYAVIQGESFFNYLESNAASIMSRSPRVLETIIKRCCEIKADIVARDEKETGLRAVLNFGHTFGHALELLGGYSKWLHGEAVSLGILMAARLSNKELGFPREKEQRLFDLLTEFNLPVTLKGDSGQSISAKAMIEAMGMDKKTIEGEKNFVLTKDFGDVRIKQKVENDRVAKEIESFL
jgi:3-dehydroquinate synthase